MPRERCRPLPARLCRRRWYVYVGALLISLILTGGLAELLKMKCVSVILSNLEASLQDLPEEAIQQAEARELSSIIAKSDTDLKNAFGNFPFGSADRRRANPLSSSRQARCSGRALCAVRSPRQEATDAVSALQAARLSPLLCSTNRGRRLLLPQLQEHHQVYLLVIL